MVRSEIHFAEKGISAPPGYETGLNNALRARLKFDPPLLEQDAKARLYLAKSG
jgi:hypothetical protein